MLLVEDEALVGMMMTDFLRDIGFHVVGPFGRVAEAIDAIEQEQLQAAILDINLRGELIYDLADELTGRGVPIVFVTGYGADAVDRRFAEFPGAAKAGRQRGAAAGAGGSEGELGWPRRLVQISSVVGCARRRATGASCSHHHAQKDCARRRGGPAATGAVLAGGLPAYLLYQRPRTVSAAERPAPGTAQLL